MSASLVGSEMCIRDRPTMGSGPEARAQWPSPAQHSNDKHGRELLPLAVSYTHLTLPTICSV
eukprot:1567295-Alexandrium_andersonii.AAC.1